MLNAGLLLIAAAFACLIPFYNINVLQRIGGSFRHRLHTGLVLGNMLPPISADTNTVDTAQ